MTLTGQLDRRAAILSREDNALRSGPLYKILMNTTGTPQEHKNRTPPRVQFFTWLLVQERIHCRVNLLKKNIVDSAECELCQQENEDCNHLIFTCPFAAQAWTTLGVDTRGAQVAKLWTVPRPTTTPNKHYDCFLQLICWQIWKHRNGVIFRGDCSSLARFWATCKEDALLWSNRWPSLRSYVLVHTIM